MYINTYFHTLWKIHGARKRNTWSHISGSTGVDVARNILHYLHREIERTIFLRETDVRKWLMQTTGGWRRFPHMECCSPREIVIMPPWFYKDTRAWPVFSYLSAPGSPICYCETPQSRDISFGKDQTSFTGTRIADTSNSLLCFLSSRLP